MERIKAFLEVSRWKIQLVSLATILLGPLYSAEFLSEIFTYDVLFFALYFLFTITFACNINCYYDRGVDSLGKKHLSNSVDIVGLSNLKKIMIVESIFIFALFFFFIYRNQLVVALLGLLGWVFAYIYSSPPTRLKSKGPLGVIPVNLGVYVLPILAGYLIIDPNISLDFLLFILGYVLLNLGINLVNVAEDYDVDKRCNIFTIAHKLGIRKTMSLASVTTILGGIIVLITLYLQVNTTYSTITFLLLLITVVFTSLDISSTLLTGDIKTSAQTKGKRLPLYFISTRYPMVLILLLSLI